MINLIETLIGVGIASIIAGLVFRYMKRPHPSARMLYLGVSALVIGLILELYVRLTQ